MSVVNSMSVCGLRAPTRDPNERNKYSSSSSLFFCIVCFLAIAIMGNARFWFFFFFFLEINLVCRRVISIFEDNVSIRNVPKSMEISKRSPHPDCRDVRKDR